MEHSEFLLLSLLGKKTTTKRENQADMSYLVPKSIGWCQGKIKGRGESELREKLILFYPP